MAFYKLISLGREAVKFSMLQVFLIVFRFDSHEFFHLFRLKIYYTVYGIALF